MTRFFPLALSLLGLFAAEPALSERIVSKVEKDKYDELYAVNTRLAAITVIIDFEQLDNTVVDARLPVVVVVPARQTTPLLVATVRARSESNPWRYRYDSRWLLGSYLAVHDRNHVYALPYHRGTRHEVLQGSNGSFSHQGKYAIDWSMPEGTPVLAARDGLVVDAVGHYTVGAADPDLMDSANVVRILHDDGTIASYQHLRPNGLTVRVGQAVRAGDRIAFSGNTGYSTRPHLHLQVSVPNRTEGHRTFPLRFQTLERGETELHEGDALSPP